MKNKKIINHVKVHDFLKMFDSVPSNAILEMFEEVRQKMPTWPPCCFNVNMTVDKDPRGRIRTTINSWGECCKPDCVNNDVVWSGK